MGRHLVLVLYALRRTMVRISAMQYFFHVCIMAQWEECRKKLTNVRVLLMKIKYS